MLTFKTNTLTDLVIAIQYPGNSLQVEGRGERVDVGDCGAELAGVGVLHLLPPPCVSISVKIYLFNHSSQNCKMPKYFVL